MALQTSGQVRVEVDRATAFDLVGDPVRLAQCIPGCKDLRELSPGLYSAVLTNEVAFITLSFKVTVEVVKLEPPSAIEAKITGEAIGLIGRVAANAELQLSETGPGQTDIRYTTSVGLTGKLGGLGEPVFRAKSAEVAREFAANLKAAIEQTPTKVRP
ncbi:MAG TPA: SRPBCC domain-containing protein [Terriglobia bacterium]|nr:SRPBCC domain-containing protein [Terriglobia bacterium]